MNRIRDKMSSNSENPRAELRNHMKQQTRARTGAEAVSCGHHYFNPQWVYQDQNTPALMYNDAVYFTVSDDGTHYFHQSFKGEFYPVIPSMVSEKNNYFVKTKSQRKHGAVFCHKGVASEGARG